MEARGRDRHIRLVNFNASDSPLKKTANLAVIETTVYDSEAGSLKAEGYLLLSLPVWREQKKGF